MTVGALLLILFCTTIPLPGIDLAVLERARYANSLRPLSIGALTVTPIITALCLAQLIWLIGPRRWSDRVDVAGIPGWVLWLALALAVVQAGGLATASEAVAGLVPEPGTVFRIGCIFSLTAATFAIWWLADVITRHGLGSGLWLVFLVPFLRGLGGMVPLLYEAVATGRTGMPVVFVLIGALVLPMVLVTAIVVTGPRSDRGEAMLWPLLISTTALNVLVLPLWLSANGQYWLNVISASPIRLVLVVGLMSLFVFLWNGRHSTEPASRARNGLQAMVLGLIVVADDVLTRIGPDFAFASSVVIVTLVMLNIIRPAL